MKALRLVFGRTFGCRLSCFVEVFAFATLLGVVVGLHLTFLTGHWTQQTHWKDRR